MAGGHYEKGLFQQLQETIARLEEVEKQRKLETAQLRQIIETQAKQIMLMSKEIQLLREENDRLRSILNNNSGNFAAALHGSKGETDEHIQRSRKKRTAQGSTSGSSGEDVDSCASRRTDSHRQTAT